MRFKFLSIAVFVVCSLAAGSAGAQPRFETFKQAKTGYGVFAASLKATGLTPKKRYVVTLNGYKGDPSSSALEKKCNQVWDQVGYCDLPEEFATDKGELVVDIKESFPKGKFKIKVQIKDVDNQYKVVLSKDSVVFEVK